ncbi:MAG: ABC-F family ATP-binding cassette domain-containing protein [Paludibacteraceae bacterium]|nr:ABC-F family ATP-binding cassette domain-containing protein [Paludibacteraceae bacterium]
MALSVENIVKEYSSLPILAGITFLVNRRDRIALVGKNGAGKTTLLRLIADEETPTSGHISRDADMRIGYLPQQMIHNEGTTLREEVDNVRDKQDPKSVGQMERVLLGLGFERTDFDRPCNEFSGGWRMRIELAKILLQQPDLLLLDEPTNHLDIESIQWLEDWIQSAPCAAIIVSHDRAFIDNVTTRTIEISLGRIYDYNVPYSQFVTLRQERHEQQVRAYENQQKMIKDTEEFIERFRYKATKSVQVQSRIKQLNKLERLEVDLEDNSRLRMKFPPAPRSGDFPVIADNVRKAFGEHVVFDHVTFTIRRGEKVAFVGKNGEGKTTLVRCIMNELQDYTGTLKIGHNVKIGYFAQNQASLLDGELTVFDTIDRVAVGDIRTRIKDILGAFMFGGEAIDKRVKVLSGGERSRLAMIRLLLEPVNLLILDEPTNHLDMRSKDVLKEALQAFDGTVILVSHDRDFLDGIVSKVYEFGGGKVREHLGGIYDWLQYKRAARIQDADKAIDLALQTRPQPLPHKVGSNYALPNEGRAGEGSSGATAYAAQKAKAAELRKAQKAVAQAEQDIAALEQQILDIEQILAEVKGQSPENFEKYNRLKRSLEQRMYEWEILSEELEEIMSSANIG